VTVTTGVQFLIAAGASRLAAVTRARHRWITAVRQRVGAALWPAVHASVAAAVAWLLAHNVLGHADPFFAPIAAAIALSTTQLQRGLRSVQMVLGVVLGISIGRLLGSALGASAPAVGLVVLATLLSVRALGAGFLGNGMMFANQAASSAILVVVLHSSGTGAERELDAVVGGAVALVVGVLAFPAKPLPRLREAESAVLGSLATTLEGLVSLLRARTPAEEEWTLTTAYDLHQGLANLAEARSSARTNVRIAPRRWRLRGLVDAEDRRLARLHLLADAVLGLVRAATGALEDRQPLPASLELQIAALGTAIGQLASTSQPWPPRLLLDVAEVAGRAPDLQAEESAGWVPVVASTMRTTARDLREIIRLNPRPRARKVGGGRFRRVRVWSADFISGRPG
jgi:uncharacterized membrane protein YgaE (UPF0421/DUF939 family)